jgi:hypothetical protein
MALTVCRRREPISRTISVDFALLKPLAVSESPMTTDLKMTETGRLALYDLLYRELWVEKHRHLAENSGHDHAASDRRNRSKAFKNIGK